jgi:hypothetical protein
MEIGGMETSSIAQAFYGASPVSGTMDGKFSIGMASPTLTGLIESSKLDGSVLVNKPTVTSIDLARTAQAGTLTGGQTRFGDLDADLSVEGARVHLRNVRASNGNGLFLVNGGLDIGADKALAGTLNIELGSSSNRTKAAMKVSGTPADIKLTKVDSGGAARNAQAQAATDKDE